MFNPEVLPFDEVTELPIHHFTVQDFFYHPFLFSVDDLRRWRGSRTPSRDWVVRSWSQFYYIEHRVDTASDLPGPAQSREPGQAGPVWAGPGQAIGDGPALALAWLRVAESQSHRPEPVALVM
jgi:hypothetical protein